MALIRILVDGYSLLHAWPELAPHLARHTEGARDELVAVLTRYSDFCGTPITIVFDGAGARGRATTQKPGRSVEVIYTSARHTADDLIERAAQRFQPYGEVMVVTDDHHERDTVSFFGGIYQSCLGFIQTIESENQDLARDIANHNFRERTRFRRAPGKSRQDG